MAVVGLNCLKKSYYEHASSFYAIYYLVVVWGIFQFGVCRQFDSSDNVA